MDNHLEAWERVKPHLFGEVVEVTRTTPWGFKEDRKDILNLSVDDFLSKKIQTDTIILHILSGEGEPQEKVKQCIEHAKRSAVKVVILEHTGREHDIQPFKYTEPALHEDWGRNELWAFTTFERLELHQLSDLYVKIHLNDVFVEPHDEGIDPKTLVYTHTSEKPIDFELPEGEIYWVIGGGFAYESMQKKNTNILFDTVLRQVLYCAYKYEKDKWKIEKIWKDVSNVQVSEDYRQWRVVKPNNIKPDKILHGSFELCPPQATTYVSTVRKELWQHLTGNIVDCYTERDTCKLWHGNT